MKRKMLLLGLALVSGGAYAQQGVVPPTATGSNAPVAPRKQMPAVAVDTKTPVTDAEARATFKKVIANLPSITGKPIPNGMGPLPDSSKPITREDMLAELDFVFNLVKPEFKFTPRTVWYDPKVITVKNGASKKILDKMIKWGCVARVCPLATSKADTISLDDFAYTVGYFVTRLGDLTHMPEPKNTPILEPG